MATRQPTEDGPDSKVHGANMGPIWGRQDPDGPHVGPMNFVIWAVFCYLRTHSSKRSSHSIKVAIYYNFSDVFSRFSCNDARDNARRGGCILQNTDRECFTVLGYENKGLWVDLSNREISNGGMASSGSSCHVYSGCFASIMIHKI